MTQSFRSAVNLSTVLLLVHQLSKLLLNTYLCLDNWSLSHLVSRLYCPCSTLCPVVCGNHFAYSPLAPAVQLQGLLVDGMLSALQSFPAACISCTLLASCSCSCTCGAGQLASCSSAIGLAQLNSIQLSRGLDWACQF